ncbi:MAG TPA: hypothetical protein PLP27_05170 [Crocinitomicaceae bacterium]|nr:hypothetical protein [Crocinitomicaceae bacterium]
MRKLKLVVIAVVAMLFLGINNVNAQEKSSEIVIIRVLETSASRTQPCITTTDSEGKVTKIELEKGWKDESVNNQILIQNELKKWKSNGYKITHLSTSGGTSGDIPIFLTTIILEK